VKAPSYNETGFITTTPPSSTVLIPDNVAAKTGEVFAVVNVVFPCTMSAAMAKNMNLNVVRKRGNVCILMTPMPVLAEIV